MRTRSWILIGLLAALGLTFVAFFTEWLRPAPIEIASQVRFAVQPPRFGAPPKKPNPPPQAGQDKKKLVQNERNVPPEPFERIGRPEKGGIEQAPGGVANVTFSLDAWYNLT